MAQRKSRRRFNPWKRISRAYKAARRLHEHEEMIVLALLVERGPSSSGEWDSQEPGRWNERMLNGVFRRLRRKQHVKRAGIATPSIFGAGRRCRYAITELGRKRLEVEGHERLRHDDARAAGRLAGDQQRMGHRHHGEPARRVD